MKKRPCPPGLLSCRKKGGIRVQRLLIVWRLTLPECRVDYGHVRCFTATRHSPLGANSCPEPYAMIDYTPSWHGLPEGEVACSITVLNQSSLVLKESDYLENGTSEM